VTIASQGGLYSTYKHWLPYYTVSCCKVKKCGHVLLCVSACSEHFCITAIFISKSLEVIIQLWPFAYNFCNLNQNLPAVSCCN
jgi:hypothetical protein